MDGKQTLGLTQAAAITEERCAETCCGDPTCETYQYCNSSACGSGPPQQGACWVGKVTGAKSQPSAGWIGKARTVAPGPSPSNSTTTCTEEWCRVTTDDSKWRTVDVPHDVRRCRSNDRPTTALSPPTQARFRAGYALVRARRAVNA